MLQLCTVQWQSCTSAVPACSLSLPLPHFSSKTNSYTQPLPNSAAVSERCHSFVFHHLWRPPLRLFCWMRVGEAQCISIDWWGPLQPPPPPPLSPRKVALFSPERPVPSTVAVACHTATLAPRGLPWFPWHQCTFTLRTYSRTGTLLNSCYPTSPLWMTLKQSTCVTEKGNNTSEDW